MPVAEGKSTSALCSGWHHMYPYISARILAKLRGGLRGWRLRRADGAGCEQRREDVQKLSKWKGGGCGHLVMKYTI